MGLTVYREYLGNYQLVGRFERESATLHSFVYDEQYLASANAQAISFSLPLQSTPFSHSQNQGFFEGMLPEGPTRTELAHRFHVSPSNYLTLLERLGSECIGALLFRSNEESEGAFTPHYDPMPSSDLSDLSKDPDTTAATCMQISRLSLAGAQSKTGLYLERSTTGKEQSWLKPIGSAPSTHIVKIASSEYSSLPHNELACMELARACGFPVADTFVPDLIGRALASQRYDRIWPKDTRSIDGRPAPLRLHQEDFCQALGWPSYMKYEINDTVSYAIVISNIIQKISSDFISDKLLFARQTLFNYFVGNCDNHLKNHSFLYSPSWNARRLAPLYDIVCTTLLGFDRKMGFEIGNHQVIDEITEDDWRGFAHDISLNESTVMDMRTELAESIRTNVPILLKTLPPKAADQLKLIFADMQERLPR